MMYSFYKQLQYRQVKKTHLGKDFTHTVKGMG